MLLGTTGNNVEVKHIINDRLTRYSHTDMYSRIGLMYEYSNAIKYVLRAPFKNGLEDLNKAIECLTQMRDALQESLDLDE